VIYWIRGSAGLRAVLLLDVAGIESGLSLHSRPLKPVLKFIWIKRLYPYIFKTVFPAPKILNGNLCKITHNKRNVFEVGSEDEAKLGENSYLNIDFSPVHMIFFHVLLPGAN
jgi:hypothetical protein